MFYMCFKRMVQFVRFICLESSLHVAYNAHNTVDMFDIANLQYTTSTQLCRL